MSKLLSIISRPVIRYAERRMHCGFIVRVVGLLAKFAIIAKMSCNPGVASATAASFED